MTTQNDWPSRLTRSIAGEIERHRKARGWSRQRLADECGKAGMDIPRSLITDLEIGRRAHLSIAELLVLARALDVPPILLVFPVGSAEDAEVLPGETRPAFRCAQWFSGENLFPEPDGEGLLTILTAWNSGAAAAMVLYRQADEAFEDGLRATVQAGVYDDQAAGANDDQARKGFASAAAAQRELADSAQATGERIRAHAEAAGILPPPPVTRFRIPRTEFSSEMSKNTQGEPDD